MKKVLLIVALLLTTVSSNDMFKKSNCLFAAEQFSKSLLALDTAAKTGNKFLIKMKRGGVEYTAVSVITECDGVDSAKSIVKNANQAIDDMKVLKKKGY